MPQHREPPPRGLPFPPPPHRLWGGAEADPALAKGALRDSPCRRKSIPSHLFSGNASIKSLRFLLLHPRPGQECLFPDRKPKNMANYSLLHPEGQGKSKPGPRTARSIPAESCNVPDSSFVWGAQDQVGQPQVCHPLRAAASLASRSVTVLCNVPCPSAHFPPPFLGQEMPDFLSQRERRRKYRTLCRVMPSLSYGEAAGHPGRVPSFPLQLPAFF